MSLYSAAIVGLTGIGAARPANDKGPGLYAAMPRSHAAAYYRHPQTQLRAVCDQNPTALEQFRQTWQDVWPEMRPWEVPLLTSLGRAALSSDAAAR